MMSDSRDLAAAIAVPAVVAAYFLGPTVERLPLATQGYMFMAALALLLGLSAVWRRDMSANRATLYILAILAPAALAWSHLATGVQRDEEANDRRCLAVQHDMLSARPRRADGPDLFQALGCRPQGEGSVYASSPSTKDKTHVVLPPK